MAIRQKTIGVGDDDDDIDGRYTYVCTQVPNP